MKRLFAMFSLLFFVLVVQAQSITHKAFDTNGPVGECLFPEDAEGNIVYSDIIQCGLSADTIKGLFREWLYTLKQEQRADIDEELDGVTKMVCEIELPIGKEFYKMSVPYGEIATFERHTSQVTFISIWERSARTSCAMVKNIVRAPCLSMPLPLSLKKPFGAVCPHRIA